MSHALSTQQTQQFHDDGFFVLRGVLPDEAMRPLIDELENKIDDLTKEAVSEGLLDVSKTFDDAPFDRRLALVCDACRERNWIWRRLQHGKYKSPGMFQLRTAPELLDIVESLIGPEIYGHPQYALRAKMPNHEETVVPWHQDLGYLVPEDAGETLFVNCWLPFVDATGENGCLQVIRGSHRFGFLPHEKLLDMADHTATKGIPEADIPEGEIVTCEVSKSDVLLTMERVVHRSIPNRSDTVRWSLDTRYSQLGLPTGRTYTPGFVARSAANPDQVAKSYEDWVRIFEEAGIALDR